MSAKSLTVTLFKDKTLTKFHVYKTNVCTNRTHYIVIYKMRVYSDLGERGEEQHPSSCLTPIQLPLICAAF